MADYFADSSALVKRYVSEVGSTWVAGLFNPSLRNEISGVEIVAAIARRARWGDRNFGRGFHLQPTSIGLGFRLSGR